MMRLSRLLLTLLLMSGIPYLQAKSLELKTETGKIKITSIASGLDHPWGMAFLPDNSILVTERGGNLRIVKADGSIGESLAGLPNIMVKGQGGLLDVVLAPDFATSKKIYFCYSEPGEKANGTAVSFATLKGAQLENVTRVFSQQPKVDSNNHFGCRLVWAPDGKLFITLGERFSRKEDAQLLNNHLGKVVRINADGTVPADNPFTKTPGALPEIWSYGHRNVQGAAINPVTQQLWTGEHGPQGGDELNLDLAGKNYGWPVITYGENYGGGKIGEGTHKDGMEQPLHYWVPSPAITGFIFYTGDKFPGWKQNIIMTSLAAKTLFRLTLNGNKVVGEERLLSKELNERLRHVVQGPDGLIYFLSDEDNGSIYQISPKN